MRVMEAAASDVLTADDPLYEELYDVRREAEAMGNFIERDVTAEIAALRAQAPVHKGKAARAAGPARARAPR